MSNTNQVMEQNPLTTPPKQKLQGDPRRHKEWQIAIDTREQLPYEFGEFDDVVVKTLESGDYSIVGLEDRVAVERKTLADAYGSLGRGRARFEREWRRLSKLEFAAVVIEACITDFVLNPPPYSKMSPQSAIHTLLGWSVKYGVHVYFCGNRIFGEAVTLALLGKFWKYEQERLKREKQNERG